MASYTDHLKLKLPNGSKYWNYDTWCENMKILDREYKNIEKIIIDRLLASNITYGDTNVQDAIDTIVQSGSWIKFVDVNSPTNFVINSNAHNYLTLAFGPSVPGVAFQNREGRSIEWINGYPTFEPNSVYELSFLDLSCVWAKREDIDWKLFFEYYIDGTDFHITRIKVPAWYEHFGNYDFIIPRTVDGMRVILHS